MQREDINIDSAGNDDKIIANEYSLSGKKRKPTMMPFNLPGDDIDHFEKLDKNEETK